MTIHKEGYKLITGAAVLCGGIIFGLTKLIDTSSAWFWLASAPVVVFFYLVVQFFRLPSRTNRSAANELVAPCDGKVVVIEETEEPEFIAQGYAGSGNGTERPWLSSANYNRIAEISKPSSRIAWKIRSAICVFPCFTCVKLLNKTEVKLIL